MKKPSIAGRLERRPTSAALLEKRPTSAALLEKRPTSRSAMALLSRPAIEGLFFLRLIARQRTRATIAASMVTLGVASTLITVSLSTGARLELEAEQNRIGKNLFYIRAAERPISPGRGNGWYVSTRLKPEQAKRIERDIPAVLHAVPVRERTALAKLDASSVTTTVRGVTPEFFELRNFEVERGRAITPTDNASLQRVAVLGPFVKERLTNAASLVGTTLRIGGVPFLVIGELRAKGAGSDGSNLDDQILVPFETAIRRLDNVESASLLLVQARDADAMQPAMEGARGLLRTAHYIDPGARDDFDILETIRQNFARDMNGRWMRGLARILTIVTLALGGAGVLAVTYLNVKERTSEIGLRMALGATRLSIARLFLFEACMLSALGGIAGLIIGSMSALALRALTGWSLVIDLDALTAALAVSALTGVVCSLLPAWRASQVMPARTLVE